MNIIQIIEISLIVTMLMLVLKKERPEIAVQISLLLSVIIFLIMLDKIQVVLILFRDMAERANMNYMYLQTILKIIGIAYIAEFGSQVCRDAGEGAVANKIEFAAKILIMVMAVPIIALVLDTIVRLLPR